MPDNGSTMKNPNQVKLTPIRDKNYRNDRENQSPTLKTMGTTGTGDALSNLTKDL